MLIARKVCEAVKKQVGLRFQYGKEVHPSFKILLIRSIYDGAKIIQSYNALKIMIRLTKASRKTLLARTSLKHSVITTCSEVNGRHGLISRRINEQRVSAAFRTEVCKSRILCDVHF